MNIKTSQWRYEFEKTCISRIRVSLSKASGIRGGISLGVSSVAVIGVAVSRVVVIPCPLKPLGLSRPKTLSPKTVKHQFVSKVVGTLVMNPVVSNS